MNPLLAFDLDGTLIDSANDICNAVNLTLKNHKHASLDPSIIRAHIGEGLQKLILDFFPEYSSDSRQADAIVDEFLQNYGNEMLRTTELMPGVLDFLQNYPGPVGIITNKVVSHTHVIIDELKLRSIPWVGIYGAETWPEKKPSPMPLQKMMSAAGRTSEQSFMIGDGTPDMESAQRAQVRSIAIEFGYTDMKILNRYKPAATLTHYSELRRVITGLGS